MYPFWVFGQKCSSMYPFWVFVEINEYFWTKFSSISSVRWGEFWNFQANFLRRLKFSESTTGMIFNPTTIFLDVKIDNEFRKISQFFKPMKKLSAYVPFSSHHPFHTLKNIPKNLFSRALTLNPSAQDKNNAFTLLSTGLVGAGYPIKLLDKSKKAATKIKPIRVKNMVSQDNIIYLTLTNNTLNTANPLFSQIAHLNYILHMDTSHILSHLTIKISKRQPASIAGQNTIMSSAHKNNNPQPCPSQTCHTCSRMHRDKMWVSSSGLSLTQARWSCKTKNLIYFCVDPITNEVYYIGHTGQTIGTRFYQHKKGKLKLRTSTYKIVAISGSESIVKRLEVEQHYIELLDPTWNVQKCFNFWMKESNHSSQTT